MAISVSIPFVRTQGTYLEVDPSRALQGLVGLKHRLLIIGQRLTSGDVAANTPVLVVSETDAQRKFGLGSMLAGMVVAAKRANPYTEMWAVALDDDAAGVAASGTLTFGGAPTAAGTVSLMIAGQRVRVGVASGDTPAEVATAAAAAINAAVGLPVTAVADAAVVTVTARHKGEAGNYLDLRHSYYTGEALPKGLTLAVVAMSGGTANPDLADALASLAGRRFHRVVSPYTDAANLTAIEEWITERSGPLVKLRGRVYTAYPGTIAEMSTQGNTRNCARVTCVGSGLIPSPPEIMAAVWGAVAAYYINIDCARPLQTLALPGILPPPPADIPDISERNILLYDGISTFTVDDGGVVRIERSITTYQTNALGVEDPAYLDDNTVSTLDEIIDQTEIRITNRYPRHKLADDNANVGAGQAVARPKDVRAELIALFRELENNGIVEGLDQFMNDLVVERDATDKNRLNALIPPDLVGQFRVFAGVIQFIL